MERARLTVNGSKEQKDIPTTGQSQTDRLLHFATSGGAAVPQPVLYEELI
jgi:hypothetical protein